MYVYVYLYVQDALLEAKPAHSICINMLHNLGMLNQAYEGTSFKT